MQRTFLKFKLHISYRILFISIFICHQHYSHGQAPDSAWTSIDNRPVPGWFEDAKLGIFIHWGVYSVPAWAPNTGKNGDGYAEWYWQQLQGDNDINKRFRSFHDKVYGRDFRYPYFAKSFTAELFDPEKWAEIIKSSGARYVILTSKHHDGFTLWPSKQSWNWNASDIGPCRDLLGDLTKSVHSKGLKMGYYYSLYEWFNPLYKTDIDKYVDQHMIPQIKDLVNNYKPDVLWMDGEWDHTSDTWKSEQILEWLYTESAVKSKLVVNDRWGKGTRGKHGGFYTSEYGDTKGAPKKDAITKPWEECRGIGSSFGYNRNENLENYSSSKQLIHLLIDVVSRGGNLLLNIGPASDGSIPVIMQQRLSDMGHWLEVNKEGIYNSRKWDNAPPLTSDTNIHFTRKGEDLFAICSVWHNDSIVIRNIKRPRLVTLLGYKEDVKFEYRNGVLLIKTPAIHPRNIPCDYAWTFKVSGAL